MNETDNPQITDLERFKYIPVQYSFGPEVEKSFDRRLFDCEDPSAGDYIDALHYSLRENALPFLPGAGPTRPISLDGTFLPD